MYWDKLEQISPIKRDDYLTWITDNWPSSLRGNTTKWGIPHC